MTDVQLRHCELVLSGTCLRHLAVKFTALDRELSLSGTNEEFTSFFSLGFEDSKIALGDRNSFRTQLTRKH